VGYISSLRKSTALECELRSVEECDLAHILSICTGMQLQKGLANAVPYPLARAWAHEALALEDARLIA
jgi:hypothetical protein